MGSWVQQVSFEPLLISLAIKQGRACYQQIQEKGRFTVNILGESSQHLMKPFTQKNSSPFKDLEKEVHSFGVDLLETVASFHCEKKDILSTGDHDLIIAEVLQSRHFKPQEKPYVHIRKSGLNY